MSKGKMMRKLEREFAEADERNDVEAMFELSARITEVWAELLREDDMLP